MSHVYALILAGGKGTRLWPLSQPNQPKALLSLFGEQSLFQATVARLDSVIPADQVFVVAKPELCRQLYEQTPSIPESNFIHEPSEKDSGPALALAALHIAQRDPDAIIAVLSVDNHIDDEQELQEALHLASTLAAENWIVTLGIPPHRPETRFGYIQRGKPFQHANPLPINHVEAFIEKPDLETAASFIRSGQYLWDSGIIVLKAQRIIYEFDQQQPALMDILRSGKVWSAIQPISLDYAIMQRATNIVVIEVNFGWHDVGNWDTVFDIEIKDSCGNAIDPQHIVIDTQNTLIRSQRQVVAIGLDDLMVVDTEDGLLICKRGQSEQVRSAVLQLNGKTK